MCYQQISVFRPIGTPWHVFFHRGCDIGDTWKYGQAWPNSGDSKVHFAHCGCNYCICRFGWSQLISSTSCDVQIWIAVSKMSFRSCSAAKSEMYHRRFWVRPALGLTWSIFAYNDTKLQPLPPTSKDTNGKQRKEKDPTKENLHQLTNSEPKRSTGLQKPGKRFGESARHCFGRWKLCGFFDDRINRINRCGVCQELCVLQQVWIPGRIVGALPTESPWKTSRNTSKWLREKQMNRRQAQHLLRANTS